MKKATCKNCNYPIIRLGPMGIWIHDLKTKVGKTFEFHCNKAEPREEENEDLHNC